MPLIDIRVVDEEVLVILNELPRKIQRVLESKLDEIFQGLKTNLTKSLPGKYLDQQYIRLGVSKMGDSTLVGYLEGDDKPGVYSIFPSKAQALRFFAKGGELVYSKRVLNHPYLKSAPHLARLIAESKPWIEEELWDAVVKAL